MTTHAVLSASGAHRWLACPASVRLSKDLPERPSGPEAREGTAVHDVAERCLKAGDFANLYPGDMRLFEIALPYIKYVERLSKGRQRWLERKFSLKSLHPPMPMFGTADCVIWAPEHRVLSVVDLKTGKWPVDVKNNPQLRYYALGALVSLHDEWLGKRVGTEGVERVCLTIVQPRAAHPDGPIRHEWLSVEELVAWGGELLAGAHAAAAPDSPTKPGECCRFCPAKMNNICPEFTKC